MSIDMKDVRQVGVRTPESTAAKTEKTANANSQDQSATLQRGATSGGSGVSVSLTQAGMQLAQLEKGLAKQPVVNNQRVDQIRQKLQSGSYQIDPARIANKLLNQEFPAKS